MQEQDFNICFACQILFLFPALCSIIEIFVRLRANHDDWSMNGVTSTLNILIVPVTNGTDHNIKLYNLILYLYLENPSLVVKNSGGKENCNFIYALI